jgi:2-polyprenyl-3-methyl-5-hydroxy-6-metoxy-1,4-benzoquinol methylase
MKYVDRMLQCWRIRKAAAFINRGDRVLDIGCADGALFRLVPGLGESAGVEPELRHAELPQISNVSFYAGYFPDAVPPLTFDVITVLAVLEHVPATQQASLAQACASYLRPGGKLVITVPSPAVDHVLPILQSMRLIDGMSLDQHYGFESSQTPDIFSPHGLSLLSKRRFQLGMNNLFVFQRN